MQEVHTRQPDIHSALNDKRAAIVAELPDWMKRDNTHVRFGGQDIQLDEGTLPRLDGIMGAVHLFRKGEADMSAPRSARLNAPQGQEDAEQSTGALVARILLEAAGVGASAAVLKKGKGNRVLVGLGMLGLIGSGGMLASELTACGASPNGAPTAIATEISSTAIPATEIPVNITVTPLSNDVVVGTPSSSPETPAPVTGASYPTEVINLESPLVYSYGGESGRQNMNEYTRQLFDRYIAEMSRGGFLTGTSVEELYRSFDQGYDFKLYTTDNGLTWLVQSKSDGGFLVPKDKNGQIFRDLQLPYDYLFASGAAVGVGTDNFDFQRFQANKVGFVGAWPVLVNVDSQDIPVSWANMEQSGVVSPITMASTVEAPTATVATPTEVVATPTEAGPKEGDTKTVTENGHDYKYVYKEGLGWERQIGSIILFDMPLRNYIPFSISALESVQGEHSFVSITHKDNTDINAANGYLTRTFKPELEKRYFQDDPRKNTLTNTELQTALQMEMQGMGTGEHTQAYIDIIVANGTPEGKVEKVKLSQTTGIKLMIMNEADITQLGGENVIALNVQDNGQDYAFFVDVYGVDPLGNELVRIAFKDPLSQIPESVFRKVLFSIPGNLVDHKDQREQGFGNVAQIFAQYSEKLNDDGTYDVQIDLAPPAQP